MFDENLLSQHGRNLNTLAKEGKLCPVIAREKEIQDIQEILCRREQNNVILIGDPGVGKTAIVEGLAGKIVRNEVHERLKNKEIIQINLGTLVAGTRLRGEFESRVDKIVKECQKNSNIILFFSDVHQIVGAGGHGISDASNLLKPYLIRGDLHCIGTTTINDYQKYIEKDPALVRGFQALRIDEPSRLLTREILKSHSPNYASYHNVLIEEDALDAAIDLSARYIKDNCLPGKALSLIDGAASRVSLSKPNEKVTKEVIANMISEMTDIPVSQILFSKTDLFLAIGEKLRQRIYGQDAAIQKIADVIQLTKYEMDLKPDRPDGVFLLAGPTGTGKTELAKALAEALLGHSRELLRYDMSEYMEKHNVSKLIGSPPGYRGSDDGGCLTNAVKANAYSVILFDEVEKAHPDVFKLFLQIFDDGRLTDAKGMTASFSFTTIIMTTNLGARNLSPDEIRKLPPRLTQTYIQSKMEPEIKRFFSPEFLNRLDAILYFNFLPEDVISKITQSRITSLLERFSKKGIKITVSDEIYSYLIKNGVNTEYGARFLNREIEDHLLMPLTRYLLNHPGENRIICKLSESPEGAVVNCEKEIC